MCGIFGYSGNEIASNVVLDGLKRLEYRGYDSWGVAVINNNEIELVKKTGKIGEVLSEDLNLSQSKIGIGHTRWATHGSVTELNAHPHYSTDKSFVLAQNGIVQNYLELKNSLITKGYNFVSETDTEVIVRNIEDKLKNDSNILSAVRNAFLELEGRNTIIMLTKDGQIIAARNGSPLVIGLNEDTKEIFLSSDILSFASKAQKMIQIENNQFIHIVNGEIHLSNTKTGESLKYTIEDINIKDSKVDKEGFDHFMIKEINESPLVIARLLETDPDALENLSNAIKLANTVYTIGSGTAGAAAAQMAYFLRKFGKINAISLVGADSTEYFDLFTEEDLIIAPSQSGETADVLEVLEIAKAKGMKIASYVNMPGASITRMSDYKFMANAGPEVCVLSTKVFFSQIAFGYLLSKTVQEKYDEGFQNLQNLMRACKNYLENDSALKELKNLSTVLLESKDIFLMGKAQNMQIIKEGMVKFIEGTYKHAHAIPAGDLKHYAITLMQPGIPVIVLVSNDEVISDIVNAASEVKARDATTIGIGNPKINSFNKFIELEDTGETSNIMNVIPLQLLSYYIAMSLGLDIDKPRNIAKSVTVK